MANSDKNIVIIPNRGQPGQPNVVFTGNANVAMTLRVADDNSLSFENITGQLFSISNNVTSGSIFSVNDISGIPVIDANASGNVAMAPFGGNVGVGTASPTAPLHVFGNIRLGNTTTASGLVFADGTIQRTAATGGGGGAIPSGVNSASNITVTATGTDASFFPAFVEATSGNIGIRVDSALTYNPNTDALSLTGNLLIQNGGRFGNIAVTNTTASTSTATGALVVQGGVGVAGNVFAGRIATANSGEFGNVGINNTTTATSSTTGALAVQGGVGVVGNAFIASSVWAGNLSITNATASINSTSGALVVAGGVGITGQLFVANNIFGTRFTPTGGINSQPIMYLPATDTLGFATLGTERLRINPVGNVGIGTATPLGNLHVMGNLWLSNNAAFIGGVRFPDGTFQTTAAAPTPIPPGVNSASNVTVTSTNTDATFFPAFVEATTGNIGIRVDTGLTYNPLTEALSLTGNALIQNGARAGNLSVTNTTASTSNTTGALVVAGGLGLAGNIYSGGNLSLGLANNANRLGISAATSQTAIYAQSAATAGDFLVFQDSNPITRFRIDSTGAVATGTWNGSTITAPFGGTGFASYTVGDMLYASATNSLLRLNISGANVGAGNVLLNTGSIPTWGTVSNINITTTSSSATFNPIFVDSTTGNLAPRTSSSLRFVPSSGQLRVSTLDLSSGQSVTWGDGSFPATIQAASGFGYIRAYLNNDATNRQIFYGTTLNDNAGMLIGNGTNPAQTLDVRGNIVTANSTWLGNLSVTNTTQSTSTVTGAVINRGGEGIAGNLFVGGSINGANVNVTGSAAPPNGIWQPTTNVLGFATGSTERMRIDSFGNLSLGTTSVFGAAANRTSLSVNGTSSSIVSIGAAGSQQVFLNYDGTNGYLYATTSALFVGSQAAQPLIMVTNNTERARIDQFGNLSLGTSSVFYAVPNRTSLSVNGTSQSIISLSTGGTARGYFFSDGSTTYLYADSNGGILQLATVSSNPMTFFTGASERMRIDSLGNVAIGTTGTTNGRLAVSSFWTSSSIPVLSLADSGTARMQAHANLAAGSWNPLVQAGDAGFIYTTGSVDTGSLFLGPWTNQNRGMRLAASGNVGIGTATPQANLHVMGNIFVANSGAAIGGIRFPDGTFQTTAGSNFVQTTSTATNATFFPVFTSATSGAQGVNADGDLTYNPSTNLMSLGALNITGTTVPTNGVFLPATNTLGFSAAGGEDMRIDPTGNVAIGSTSTSVARLFVTTASNLTNAPILRLDDPSTTGATQSLAIYAQNSTAGAGIAMYGNGATTPNKYIRTLSGSWQIINSAYNSAILSLTDAGALSATNEITAYSSDGRLKGNVTVIPDALSRVCALEGVTFDWLPEAELVGFKPVKKRDVGVIAQRVRAVLPEAVALAPFDRDPQDQTKSKSGQDYLTVQYEKLTALLIEAVKEQQSVIERQDSRISVLETMINMSAKGNHQ